MDSKQTAVLAARAIDQKKGTNVTVLKLEDLTILTDFFVVATGGSRVQTQAMSDAVEEALEANGLRAGRREGYGEGRWILLDYGTVIVHVFQEDERGFYNLERLWADAPALTREEVFGEEAFGADRQ
ncbi:MAG: ribosome silencing factor [Peptococcaceae bacterium]|nr:ribosome silencing factor [Peptococcaceae bacterium]